MTLPATLTALFIAFALTILAPNNVAAQSEPPTTLNLGTDEGSGINLVLRFPVTTADDKLYYHVDHNGNDNNSGDGINGDMVDALFNSENGDADVFATQETDTTLGGMPGNHDGMPDERSVTIGNYVLVLPTVNELYALRQDQSGPPTGWSSSSDYSAANRVSANRHHTFSLLHALSILNSAPERNDSFPRFLAVQVILLPVSVPTAAPTAVTASPITGDALRIEWVAVLERDNGGAAITTYTATATDTTDTSMTFTCTADGTATDGTATNCTITGLTNGTIYRIVVTATNSVGKGPLSTAFTVIPGTPAAPTGVTLNPGFEKIVVTWTPVPDEDNGGADITSYTAYPNPVGEGQLNNLACTATAPDADTHPDNTCTITGLTNGVEYRVVVRATNSRGDSIASSGVFATLSGVFRTTDAIADQTFSVDQPVTINLPEATEGIAPYIYTLTRNSGTPLLPSGLTFDHVARTISGRPSEAFGVNGGVELVYTATDSDTPRDIGTLTFRLTVNDDALLLGGGLNLRYPVTVNGKNYYYSDRNNNGRGDRPGDDYSRSNLRNLLNGDDNTIPETQSGGHDGTDDARSVIVGSYTLVLPTITEMEALQSRRPATWWNTSYLTATRANDHNVYSFFGSGGSRVSADFPWPVAFQVIPVAVLSMADVSVAETAGTATVKVQLTNTVTNGFSVDVSTSDGTATAGEDYTALSSHTLTFNGTHNEIQTFSITIRDDNMDEGRETLTVSLSNLQNAASTVILSDTATIAIIENWLFRIKVFLEGAQ